MATTQTYQPVVVVPTVIPSFNSFNWRRRGVQVGGLVLGLPCVICLAGFGVILLLSGISALAMYSTVQSSNEIFDDDFFEKHRSDGVGNALLSTGIFTLLIGSICIIAAIGLCYVGHKSHKNYSNDSSGRVINTNPNVATTAVAAPPGGYVVGQVGSQMATYPASGQPVQYPPPQFGQQGHFETTARGQPGMYPAPGSYPAPVPGQPGQYPPPAAGYPGYPPLAEKAGPYPPPTTYHYSAPAQGQMAPLSGAPGPSSSGQYPDVASHQAPDLPQKAGLPGQVTPTAPREPYDRPPPYSP